MVMDDNAGGGPSRLERSRELGERAPSPATPPPM